MGESPVDQLARALEVTEQLVAGIRAEQWAAATPCSAWTMRDLVTHLLIGNRLFLDAVRGERPASLEGSTECAAVPDGELLGAYRASVGPLVEAFALPGALG